MQICIIVCTVSTAVDVTFPEYCQSTQCGFWPQTVKLTVETPPNFKKLFLCTGIMNQLFSFINTVKPS